MHRSFVHLTHAAAAAAAAVCVFGTLYWIRKSRRSTSTTDTSDEVVVELLPVEQVLAGGGGGENATSALTWYRGDYIQALASLQERSTEILAANPWLSGRLTKRNGRYTLVYKDTKGTVIDQHFLCLSVSETPISRDLSLDKLGGTLSSFLVKTGPTEPLWKVCIMPCCKQPQTYFALLFSLSHAVADGHTFYRLQNMLLNFSEKVDPLIVQRIATTERQQIEILGGQAEYKFLQTPGFIVNCILGVLYSIFTRTKPVNRMYYVDREGMKAAKEEAMVDADFSDTEKIPCYVSSNDILTSWFLQNTRCKYGLMALNFRGRLEGHTESHAGNYENVIFYRPCDSATPVMIRKSILRVGKAGNKTTLQRRVTNSEPMPGFMPWQEDRLLLLRTGPRFPSHL